MNLLPCTLLAIALLNTAISALPATEISSATQYEEVFKQDKPTVIMFTSPSCQPCKSVMSSLITLSAQFSSIALYTLDTTKKEFEKIIADQKIQGLPTVIYTHKGKEYKRDRSGLPYSMLQASMKEFMGMLPVAQPVKPAIPTAAKVEPKPAPVKPEAQSVQKPAPAITPPPSKIKLTNRQF